MAKSLQEKELNIHALSKEGFGLGKYVRDDGVWQDVYVPYCLPEERVLAQVLKKRKGGARAGHLLEVLQPALSRTEARCAHFGSCGGCRLQHFSYLDQLNWKEERLRAIWGQGVPMTAVLGMEDPWRYRNKMEFSFSQNKAGEQFIGLMQLTGRGKVEDLGECHLVDPVCMEALEHVRNWWSDSGIAAYHHFSDRGSLRTLTFRLGRRESERMATLTVSGRAEFALSRGEIQGFQTAVEPFFPSVFVRVQQIQKGRPTDFFEMHLAGPGQIWEDMTIRGRSFQFCISPASFFQPNTSQAENVYSIVLDLAGNALEGRVYDLYCGTGTLGVIAAAFAKEVVGIELVPEAVLDAEANAARNGVNNYRVIQGDVGACAEELGPCDLVFVDPPRAGLSPEATRHLLRIRAPKIVYISCNPENQARDVSLLQQGGYALKKLCPVDQFPHTPHLECVALLEL